MDKKNTKTKEQYIVAIKSKDSGKYIYTSRQCQADTLEKCKALFVEYRKAFEHCSKGLDFNDIQIHHRTVITTEWEIITEE